MKILDKDAEQPLMDLIDKLRKDPQGWRALHFHFSSLQPENRKPHQLHAITNVVQADMGQYAGTTYVCRDGDLIVVSEHAATKAVETMMTDFRFLFADDPLASASYVSGQPDSFCTVYDLSVAFEQFFYMCLHKLSLVNQDSPDGRAHLSPEQRVALPHPSVFHKLAKDKLDRKKPLILVVEDSYFSRQMMRQALTPKYDILLGKNGWEGLSLYLAHAPNIMFLDIDLPQMNGHEVLTRISAYDDNPFVVMLTASNLSNDIKGAIAHGAKGYIVKPFTVAKLTGYIDQYMRETGMVLK